MILKKISIDSLDDVDVLFEEAYDLYEQGDLSSSLDILEEINSFDNKNVDVLALIGLIYNDSHVFPKAIDYYRKASKISKNNDHVRKLKFKLS